MRLSVYLRLFVLLKGLSSSYAIVGGVTSKPPEPDDPVVFTPNARVEGLRKTTNGLYSFLGIRYASVSKRFTRPLYQKLSGDLNATIHGPPCAQPETRNSSKIIGAEDCLLVNIFTPKMPDGVSPLPVIVWIHGGGFRYGSAAQYSPDPLTDNNVVVVAIQYRLGTLGILGTGQREFPGNLALLDCEMAVRWTNEYIEHFGGDPKNVKVMGQGSGAVTALHLSTSPLSQSLLSGVIAMSGSLLTRNSIEEDPKQAVEQVVQLNECSGKSEDIKVIIGCLRGRRMQDLIKVDNKIETERLKKRGEQSAMTGFLNFLPHLEMKDDNRGLPGFFTESPIEKIKNKKLPSIPLLIGVTGQETANEINLQSIKGNWGSFEAFLKNLTSNLGVKEVTNTLSNALKLNLQLPDVAQYISVPETLKPAAILAKITEISTDVLFNLPATLLADAWSNSKSPAFMYHFDYSSRNSIKGREILSGLPLVSKGDESASVDRDKRVPVAHGDELAYLFDLSDVFGNRLEARNEMSPEDQQVRSRFARLITEFVSLSKNVSGGELFKSPFSNKGSSYIQISDKLAMKSDFRFCSLSLWGAPLESSSSNQMNCKSMMSIPQVIPEIPILTGKKPRPNISLRKPASGGGLLGTP